MDITSEAGEANGREAMGRTRPTPRLGRTASPPARPWPKIGREKTSRKI